MRKFNIIRYLKRWWPLIALMSILAGAFFMRYASNHQAYTAQAVICNIIKLLQKLTQKHRSCK